MLQNPTGAVVISVNYGPGHDGMSVGVAVANLPVEILAFAHRTLGQCLDNMIKSNNPHPYGNQVS